MNLILCFTDLVYSDSRNHLSEKIQLTNIDLFWLSEGDKYVKLAF